MLVFLSWGGGQHRHALGSVRTYLLTSVIMSQQQVQASVDGDVRRFLSFRASEGVYRARLAPEL